MNEQGELFDDPRYKVFKLSAAQIRNGRKYTRTIKNKLPKAGGASLKYWPKKKGE